MKILAIETSADETAVALLETTENGYIILGEALYSQAKMHAEYGGIYPSLAKREHQNNLIPLTEKVLTDANELHKGNNEITADHTSSIRDSDFRSAVETFLKTHTRPNVDLIAVTYAPGLEIALWNGITFAESIGHAWNIPVTGINHLEGHMVSGMIKRNGAELTFIEPQFPILALLISGGHTELLSMNEWFSYKLLGRTRDDAVGEAFDKVARLLGLPYPGGPEIAAHAARARERGVENAIDLPRPMIQDASCDFSFSGLKTAVLYLIKELGELTEEMKENISMEFEDAARDVLVSKTKRAIEMVQPKMLVVGGGVSANTHIQKGLEALIDDEFPDIELNYPGKGLTGDNAIMIALAAHLRHENNMIETGSIEARGSSPLA